VVSFTPRPLYPQGKSPWYPLDRRLGGPQSRSVHGGEEVSSQPLPGIEPWNPDRPAHIPALYRLSYHGSRHINYKLDKRGSGLSFCFTIRSTENNPTDSCPVNMVARTTNTQSSLIIDSTRHTYLAHHAGRPRQTFAVCGCAST
jgi:hypothetical protein